MRALKETLATTEAPLTPKQAAATFTRARVDKVEELLVTLASLGQARELPGRVFAG